MGWDRGQKAVEPSGRRSGLGRGGSDIGRMDLPDHYPPPTAPRRFKPTSKRKAGSAQTSLPETKLAGAAD
jgi:hypothetical protein